MTVFRSQDLTGPDRTWCHISDVSSSSDMNTDHRSSLLTLQNFTWTQYLRVKLGLLTILTQFHSVTVSSPLHLFTCWPGHLVTCQSLYSHLSCRTQIPGHPETPPPHSRCSSGPPSSSVFYRQQNVTWPRWDETLRSGSVGKLSTRRERWNP